MQFPDNRRVVSAVFDEKDLTSAARAGPDHEICPPSGLRSVTDRFLTVPTDMGVTLSFRR